MFEAGVFDVYALRENRRKHFLVARVEGRGGVFKEKRGLVVRGKRHRKNPAHYFLRLVSGKPDVRFIVALEARFQTERGQNHARCDVEREYGVYIAKMRFAVHLGAHFYVEADVVEGDAFQRPQLGAVEIRLRKIAVGGVIAAADERLDGFVLRQEVYKVPVCPSRRKVECALFNVSFWKRHAGTVRAPPFHRNAVTRDFLVAYPHPLELVYALPRVVPAVALH